MPVWWLEGETESRVSWVLFLGWLLARHCPASRLRQVTVCPLGNHSLAVKSARSSLGSPSRHMAKTYSCLLTLLWSALEGRLWVFVFIDYVLFQNLGLKSPEKCRRVMVPILPRTHGERPSKLLLHAGFLGMSVFML